MWLGPADGRSLRLLLEIRVGNWISLELPLDQIGHEIAQQSALCAALEHAKAHVVSLLLSEGVLADSLSLGPCACGVGSHAFVDFEFKPPSFARGDLSNDVLPRCRPEDFVNAHNKPFAELVWGLQFLVLGVTR